MPPPTFPKGFLWGAATAAHQVEGYCTNNNWWEWEQAGHINDGSVSGVACDQYRRFDDDFRLAASLGHNAHRFSIEWSRVEPAEGVFDEAEWDHYRAVCDSVRRHGMLPTLTLHHFTNPIWAQRKGGWENPAIVDWLARLAERAARALGDRVGIWWTINEPMVAPMACYLVGVHPPGVRDLGRALVVGRHVLLAHGRMYEALKSVLPAGVPVGVVHASPYLEASDPANEAHRTQAEQEDHFMNAYYLDGIATGRVAPPFGDGQEVRGLAGSFDLLGVNYYSRMLVGGPRVGLSLKVRRPDEPGEFHDEMGWEVYPPGLGIQLRRFAGYGKPLMVTENGHATLDEAARTRYLRVHLGEVARAIADGVDVRGYFYWSLLDNFEWAEGWGRHFGLLGMEKGTLARQVRPAAELLSEVARRNAVPDE